ncbi:replicative DNA helicase [Plantibacter sp. Mn2098]|uniref:replicative DNA helicase n=1 Tax=Plantibacter sp. Mn2098 TaxID=3395266 RepID=UPI003BCC69D4
MTIPDHILEAERSVLGLALHFGGEILDEVSLVSADFGGLHHAAVFEAIARLHARGEVVTTTTVQQELPNHKEAWATLVEWETSYQFDRRTLPSHGRLVAAHGLYRRLSEAGQSFAEGLAGMDSPDDLLEYARRAVEDAAGAPTTRLRYIDEILPETVRSIQAGSTFVPTPWTGLNDIIGGMRPGNLIIVAARPAVGKSVVANGLALELARHGHVALSSMEMTENEVVQRMIADRMDINIGKLKDGQLTAEDAEHIRVNRGLLHFPVAVDDRAGIGPSELRSFVRTVSREGKLSGVVVDYLQLMTQKGSKAARQELVADFSRQLKLIAKEYQVPVIALSQLNRESEGQMGRARPKMSQLRESGAIEQDADVIILLHREADDNGHLSDTEILFDVVKNRHGRVGFKTFTWEGSRSRITDFPTYIPNFRA